MNKYVGFLEINIIYNIMKLKLTAVLVKEDVGGYSSICPELDVASQGETVEEAVGNLKEAVELYLEDEDAVIPETIVKPI